MQYQKLLFAPIIILCFYSCHKTPITDMNTVVFGKVYSYYNRPDVKYDGEVIFEVNNSDNDHGARTKGADFYAGFDTTGGAVNVAGYKVLPFVGNFAPNNLAYDSLYGKSIAYSIMPPSGQGATLLTGSFYSPAPIFATNIPASTSVNILSSSTLPITWNADANNTNGVNIEADYSPGLVPNWDLAAKGDSLPLLASIMLPDNGSTDLPASFFAKFPKGATLWIFIGRGNAVYVQNAQYVYLINGFFRSSFFAVKNKLRPYLF